MKEFVHSKKKNSLRLQSLCFLNILSYFRPKAIFFVFVYFSSHYRAGQQKLHFPHISGCSNILHWGLAEISYALASTCIPFLWCIRQANSLCQHKINFLLHPPYRLESLSYSLKKIYFRGKNANINVSKHNYFFFYHHYFFDKTQIFTVKSLL